MTLYTYTVQCICIEIISLLHVFMNVDNRHVGVQKVSHLSWFACVRRPFALLHFVSIISSESATFFPALNFQSVKKDLPLFDVPKKQNVNTAISDSFGLTN